MKQAQQGRLPLIVVFACLASFSGLALFGRTEIASDPRGLLLMFLFSKKTAWFSSRSAHTPQ
jgi:hypothetical protein